VGEDALDDLDEQLEEGDLGDGDHARELVALVVAQRFAGASAGRLALVEFHRRRTAACVQVGPTGLAQLARPGPVFWL
jgi:hypothetical protein